ncbi:DUF6504 family protein [Alicyclobacillus tolerans]|uniref:DUF6504 family protein n=1 Tax=Alicyclobacillus tolerans TaxID=90970 RepID=UPI001F44EED9|nr:DUF6504 family protein [Alicyclobacillus tolerans]MCF8567932.1 DUF6504 family protein [Alicyclobacillus tolerans]
MTRIVQRPIITLQTTPKGEPMRFEDKDHEYVVERVLDHWKESGEWIKREAQRTMYRVLTRGQQVLEIQYQSGQWSIYRIYD